jgi:hypothetical protein
MPNTQWQKCPKTKRKAQLINLLKRRPNAPNALPEDDKLTEDKLNARLN